MKGWRNRTMQKRELAEEEFWAFNVVPRHLWRHNGLASIVFETLSDSTRVLRVICRKELSLVESFLSSILFTSFLDKHPLSTTTRDVGKGYHSCSTSPLIESGEEISWLACSRNVSRSVMDSRQKSIGSVLFSSQNQID